MDSCCLVPAFAGQRDAGGWGDAPTVQRIRAAPTVALTAAVQSKAVRSAALCAIRADEAVVYPPPPRAPLTAGRRSAANDAARLARCTVAGTIF